MRSFPVLPILLLTCLLVVACTPQAPEDGPRTVADAQAPAVSVEVGPVQESPKSDFGATVVEMPEPEPLSASSYEETPAEIDWTPMPLVSGKASISCSRDYTVEGDGAPLSSLGFSHLWKTMLPCQKEGMIRLRYDGKVDAGFTAMMQRVADMADTLGIESRILDIDSSGGQVEEGIKAGDAMAESGWMVWVREDSVCHSSCVLILAAGDTRLVSGPVGIHRMLRIGSKATSRAELNQELRDVHGQMSQYLQRNGAATAIADLMMTVPNRSLRLLTVDELARFGLSGRNAAEDDLDRIRLGRKCGDAFVRRKDAFFRDYDMLCTTEGEQVADLGQCGLDLKRRYRFPDADCPKESPFSEYD